MIVQSFQNIAFYKKFRVLVWIITWLITIANDIDLFSYLEWIDKGFF
jgi:hypothetical protein